MSFDRAAWDAEENALGNALMRFRHHVYMERLPLYGQVTGSGMACVLPGQRWGVRVRVDPLKPRYTRPLTGVWDDKNVVSLLLLSQHLQWMLEAEGYTLTRHGTVSVYQKVTPAFVHTLMLPGTPGVSFVTEALLALTGGLGSRIDTSRCDLRLLDGRQVVFFDVMDRVLREPPRPAPLQAVNVQCWTEGRALLAQEPGGEVYSFVGTLRPAPNHGHTPLELSLKSKRASLQVQYVDQHGQKRYFDVPGALGDVLLMPGRAGIEAYVHCVLRALKGKA